MSEQQVDVFFYGTYINFAVLSEAGITDRPYEVARLPGHRLIISPLANLVLDVSAEAHGIVTKLTHQELDRLYQEHAFKVLGGRYLPQAVIVMTRASRAVPALCYLSHHLAPGPPDPAYVERILASAREYGFPRDYLAHIESFKQQPS